jgi:hypothetical protein
LASVAYFTFLSVRSDVVFLVGPDAREIPAHRTFLAMRSPVFELMLFPQYPGQEKDSKELSAGRERTSAYWTCEHLIIYLMPVCVSIGKRMEIKVPDASPDNFLTMLRCIYTGRADHIDASNLNELIYLAKKCLPLGWLCTHCCSFFLRCCDGITGRLC